MIFGTVSRICIIVNHWGMGLGNGHAALLIGVPSLAKCYAVLSRAVKAVGL
jgi:hypothetical protein